MKNKNKTKQVKAEDITALKEKMVKANEPTTGVKAEGKNAEKAVQKIQYERDLKWKYPEGVIKTGDRKVFRQKSRNKLRRLESGLLRITEEEAKKLAMAEIEKFRKEVLTDPTAAV